MTAAVAASSSGIVAAAIKPSSLVSPSLASSLQHLHWLSEPSNLEAFSSAPRAFVASLAFLDLVGHFTSSFLLLIAFQTLSVPLLLSSVYPHSAFVQSWSPSQPCLSFAAASPIEATAESSASWTNRPWSSQSTLSPRLPFSVNRVAQLSTSPPLSSSLPTLRGCPWNNQTRTHRSQLASLQLLQQEAATCW